MPWLDGEATAQGVAKLPRPDRYGCGGLDAQRAGRGGRPRQDRGDLILLLPLLFLVALFVRVGRATTWGNAAVFIGMVLTRKLLL